LWAAATPLMDYPKVIEANKTFPDVSISELETTDTCQYCGERMR
jgi:hypothetical protein